MLLLAESMNSVKENLAWYCKKLADKDNFVTYKVDEFRGKKITTILNKSCQ